MCTDRREACLSGPLFTFVSKPAARSHCPSSAEHLLCVKPLVAFCTTVWKHHLRQALNTNEHSRSRMAADLRRSRVRLQRKKENLSLLVTLHPLESVPKPSRVRIVSPLSHSSGLGPALCGCAWGHGDREWSRLAEPSDCAHAESRGADAPAFASFQSFQCCLQRR